MTVDRERARAEGFRGGTSGPPWRSERDLSAGEVRRLVAEQFGLRDAQVAPLASGWDSDAYLVDGRFVFRFPRRAEVVPHLETELEVLPLLARRLPVAIPRPRFVGVPSERFPFPFAGYPRLPGTAAEEARKIDRDAVLDQLVAALAALHATPIEGPIARVEGWGFDPWKESAGYVDRMGLRREPPVARALDWLAGRPPPTGERVLLHGDLGMEHVLVDESTSRVTGILDWGDLTLGARSLDFPGLLMWAGAEALTRALARAGDPDVEEIVEDARTHLVHTALLWWCEAVEWGRYDPSAPADLLARFIP